MRPPLRTPARRLDTLADALLHAPNDRSRADAFLDAAGAQAGRVFLAGDASAAPLTARGDALPPAPLAPFPAAPDWGDARVLLPLPGASGAPVGIAELHFQPARRRTPAERAALESGVRLLALSLAAARPPAPSELPSASPSASSSALPRETGQERRFLRDVLASVTEGRLTLCYTDSDLPAPPAALSGEPVPLPNSDALGDVRARVRRAAERCALPPERAMALLMATGEATLNAVVHGGGAVVRIYEDAAAGVVQVWVEDNGAGIPMGNLSRATLQRGFSTGGTLGHGFHMILESADRVWLLTGARGTTVVLSVAADEAAARAAGLLDRKDAWGDGANGDMRLGEQTGALSRSRRFVELFDRLSPDILYVFDAKRGRNVWVNQAITTVLGYTPGEVQAMGSALAAHLHPDDGGTLAAVAAETARLADGQFSHAELRVRHKNGAYRWLYSRQTPFARDLDGTVTQLFGIAEDISERREHDAALRERRERFTAIFDSTLLLTVLLTPDGTLLEANRAALDFVGAASAAGVSGRAIWDAPWWQRGEPARELLRESVRHAAASGEPVYFSEQVAAAGGRVVPTAFTLVPARDAAGAVAYLIFESDISERARLEAAREAAMQALTEAERRLIEAQEIACIGSWERDVATGKLTWSPQTFRLFGFTPEGDAPETALMRSRYHPEDRPRIHAAIERAVADGTPFDLDLRASAPPPEPDAAPDSTLPLGERWLHVVGRASRDAAGKVIRLVGTTQDISDRKRVEEEREQVRRELAESERRLIEAQAITRIGSWEKEMTTERLSWSPETFRVLGFDAADGVPSYDVLHARYHPADRADILEGARAASTEGTPYDIDRRIVLPGGAVRWIRASGRGIRGEDGAIVRVVGTVQDISELRDWEVAARYRLAVSGTQSGVWEWNLLSDARWRSPEIWAILGFGENERRGAGDPLDDLYDPADLTGIYAATDDFIAGRTDDFRYEARMRHKDGSWRWLESRASAERGPGGAARRVVGIYTDVTKRKREESEREAAREALAQSERRLVEAEAAAKLGFWERDEATGAMACSAEALRLLAFDPAGDAPDVRALLARIHPDDLPRLQAAVLSAAADGGEYALDLRALLPGGTSPGGGASPSVIAPLPGDDSAPDKVVRYLHATGRDVWDGSGHIVSRLGTIQDISDRKRQESEAQWYRNLWQRVTETSPDVFYLFDAETRRNVYMSREPGDVLGYAADELGRFAPSLVDALIHPEDRERMPAYERYRDAQPDGARTEFEYRMRDGAGTWCWFCSREMVLARRADGRAKLVFGIVEEVSDRKRREAETAAALAALRESERRLTDAQRMGRIGSWEWSVAERRLTWSAETFRLLGFDPADGEPDFETLQSRYHPDDRHLLTEAFEQAGRDGTPFSFDRRAILLGDTMIWVSTTGRAVADASGHWTRFVGTVQDVSSRRSQEEATAEALTRYRLAVGGAHSGVWSWNVESGERYYSAHWRATLGYVLGETGAPASLDDAMDDADRARLRGEIEPALLRGAADEMEFEFRARHRDGSPRWLLTRARAARGAGGAVRRVTGIYTDISERKRQELVYREQAERDSRIALVLQNTVLPPLPDEVVPGLRVGAAYRPASDEAAVGGDFYDVFPLGGGRAALVVGDVIGHGLAAALSIAEVRFALRGFLSEDDGANPADALRRLHRFLIQANRLRLPPAPPGTLSSSVAVALTLAVLDPAAGTVRLTAAGMEPALIARAGAADKFDKSGAGGVQYEGVEHWDAGDLLLGVDAPAFYQAVTARLAPGDVLAISTDGLTEARPAGGAVQLGLAGLGAALTAALNGAGAGGDLAAAGAAVVESARVFSGGAFTDDVCLVLVRFSHPPFGETQFCSPGENAVLLAR